MDIFRGPHLKLFPLIDEDARVAAIPAIRTATEADAASIARVQVDTSRATYRTLVPPRVMHRLSFPERAHCWRSILTNPARRSLTWVAVQMSACVVGFAAAGPARDRALGCESELYAIYVLPEHHGHSVGTDLFRAVAGTLRAQRRRSLMAWVFADNPSRRFFEALGGRHIATAHLRLDGARLAKVAYAWDLESLPGGWRM